MNIVDYVWAKYGREQAEVRNWAPYATELLQAGKDVYFPAGVFILGDTEGAPIDSALYPNHEANRRSIVWGWGKSAGRRVSLTGEGPALTTLKVADKMRFPHDCTKVPHYMLVSRGLGENDGFDCPVWVEGIRFDGNMTANGRWTTNAVRAIGSGSRMQDCEFRDFGPGTPAPNSHSPEAFVVGFGLPTTAPQFAEGATVLCCKFADPARRRNAPAGYTTENTFLALGGNIIASRIAVGIRVEECQFSGDFDVVEQQAPLHGITVSACAGAVIENNKWTRFDGTCVYSDTGPQYDTQLKSNVANKVYRFVQHTVRRHAGVEAWRSGAVVRFRASGNVVDLVDPGTARSAWDSAPGDPTVLGTLIDPGFESQYRDVQFNFTRLTARKEFWQDRYGGFRDGVWVPGGAPLADFSDSVFSKRI